MSKVGRNELQHPPYKVQSKVPEMNENPVPHSGSANNASYLSIRGIRQCQNKKRSFNYPEPLHLDPEISVAGLLNALRGLLEPRPSLCSFRALGHMMGLRPRVADV